METNTTNVPTSEGIFEPMVEALKYHDEKISERLGLGLPGGAETPSLPDGLNDRFLGWEKIFTSAEDKEFLDRARTLVEQAHASRFEYRVSQTESKIDRMQMELSMKALSKTMSGIQQLLSAQ